jgi:hypothetical protein
VRNFEATLQHVLSCLDMPLRCYSRAELLDLYGKYGSLFQDAQSGGGLTRGAAHHRIACRIG